ncbi:TIGR02452 family protein [Candidatus Finniella inopinata]|uniref:TIGR02452 family protein n=1 Tax=Candidatus Finniella inopinata TaxID=1696036 RepID=A0A4Q7DI49_9PROT|nr:TIGR02452 family protein [Candidatus Finniella inopinata]RZI46453.1 TIGR02452 family protein [Candidatus Finniella inopinata]
MLRKLCVGFMLAAVCNMSTSYAFWSAISDQEYTGQEHNAYKGYALNAMDQLEMMIVYQSNLLTKRYQEKGDISRHDKKIASVSDAIGKLVTTGIFEYDRIVIPYGISLTPATKEQAQLMTQGLNFFARLSDNPRKLALSTSDPHQQSVRNILELASKTRLHKDVEKAMWLPSESWEEPIGGGAAAANSKNTPGGSYRTAILQQTRNALEHGYIAEDGMIVLPLAEPSTPAPLKEALRHLPNAVVKDLGPDNSSKYYPTGLQLTGSSPGYTTKYQVLQGDSIQVANEVFKRGRSAILNMANEKNPGGGARTHGSRAQEEQLCYRSNLLPILEVHETAGAYKIDNDAGKFGTSRKITDKVDCDSGIFSPHVTFIRDRVNSGFLPHYMFQSNPESYGMITSAAFDLRKRKAIPSNYKYITKAKIRFQLRSAAANGFTNLVLGAFGCGAFKGSFEDLPQRVAHYYSRVLNEAEFKGRFENVVFAIMVNGKGVRGKNSDQDNFNAFQKIFG